MRPGDHRQWKRGLGNPEPLEQTIAMRDKTLTLSVPRHAGFRLAWVILLSTLSAYRHRDQTIVFEVSE